MSLSYYEELANQSFNTYWRHQAENMLRNLKSFMNRHITELNDSDVERFIDIKEHLLNCKGTEKIDLLVQNIDLFKKVDKFIKNEESYDFDYLLFLIDNLEEYANYTNDDFMKAYLKDIENYKIKAIEELNNDFIF